MAIRTFFDWILCCAVATAPDARSLNAVQFTLTGRLGSVGRLRSIAAVAIGNGGYGLQSRLYRVCTVPMGDAKVKFINIYIFAM